MDNGSLTVEGLEMGGHSCGKYHGGALVILSLRSPWRSFGFVVGD
jgi:hypothetical protein